jgi:hypothetical protein
VQTCISSPKHILCSSANRRTGPGNYILRICHLEDMRARDPQRCMPPLSAASAPNCATQRPINDRLCRVFPETTTAVRYVGSRRQCREPTIASARRSAGLSSVLRCRTVASWPSILPSLPALVEGIYIEIDLHCVHSVSRLPSTHSFLICLLAARKVFLPIDFLSVASFGTAN